MNPSTHAIDRARERLVGVVFLRGGVVWADLVWFGLVWFGLVGRGWLVGWLVGWFEGRLIRSLAQLPVARSISLTILADRWVEHNPRSKWTEKYDCVHFVSQTDTISTPQAATTNQPTTNNRSIERTNERTNQPTNQPTDQSTNQPKHFAHDCQPWLSNHRTTLLWTRTIPS